MNPEIRCQARLESVEKMRDLKPSDRMFLHTVIFTMKWVDEMGVALTWGTVDRLIEERGGRPSVMQEWVERDEAQQKRLQREREKEYEREYGPFHRDRLRMIRRMLDEGNQIDVVSRTLRVAPSAVRSVQAEDLVAT